MIAVPLTPMGTILSPGWPLVCPCCWYHGRMAKIWITVLYLKLKSHNWRSWKTRFFLWWLPGRFYVILASLENCGHDAIWLQYLFFHIGWLKHQPTGRNFDFHRTFFFISQSRVPGKGLAVAEKMASLGSSRQFHAFFAEYSRHGEDQAFAVPWEGTLGPREHDIYAKLQEAGPQKERIAFQPSSFRCELLVSGRVEIIEFCEELGFPFMYWIDFWLNMLVCSRRQAFWSLTNHSGFWLNCFNYFCWWEIPKPNYSKRQPTMILLCLVLKYQVFLSSNATTSSKSKMLIEARFPHWTGVMRGSILNNYQGPSRINQYFHINLTGVLLPVLLSHWFPTHVATRIP